MSTDLPTCPICNHNAKVEKVSVLVERAFPLPDSNLISTLKDYKVINWAGKAYYLKKGYFKNNSKPIPFKLLLLFRNSAIEQLIKSITKSPYIQRKVWIDNLSKEDSNEADATTTALLLLPMLEKPVPLARNSSFKRFLLELFVGQLLRFLLVLLVLTVGITQNILLLTIAASILLFIFCLILLLQALLLKIVTLFMLKIHREYFSNCEKLSQAVEKWESLYYCETHDGVFTPETDTAFIHITKVQDFLFA